MKTSQKNCLAYFSFLRFKRFFFYSLLLRSLVACAAALALAQAQAQTTPAQDQLDYNAPWTADKAQTPQSPTQALDPHYQHAMDAAREALDHHDYSKAISEAKRALKYKAHDPAAQNLMQEAQKGQADSLSHAQLDKEYRKAISAAHSAFDKGNYQRALADADRALTLKPGDPEATKIKDYIDRRQAEAAAAASAARNTPAPMRVAEPSTPAPAPQPPPPANPPASETVVITPGAPQPVATAGGATVGEPPPPAAPVNIANVKVPQNQISVSGDYFLGQGNVTLPFGFSLKSLGIGFSPTVIKPSRNSDYFGGTLSYSFGQKWFLDASYAHGSSSGGFTLPFGGGPSTFTISDNWYQGYVRYAFPSLQGTHLSAYLRAGATYVTADQSDVSHTDLEYQQANSAKDILGNLGFGGLYLWHPSSRVRVGVQLEGEGFFGNRSQKTQETLVRTEEIGPTVSLSDTLYGGIGRATLRFEYAIGHSRLLRAFADGGLELKYTEISYPQGAGTFNELLWGPYIKAGIRYSF